MPILDYHVPDQPAPLRPRFRKRSILYLLLAWIIAEILCGGTMVGGGPRRLPVRVHVVDALTGQPVAGASVLLTPGGPYGPTSAITDVRGVAVPQGKFYRAVTHGLLLARHDFTSTDKTTVSAPGYLTKTLNNPLKTWKFTVFNIGTGPQARLDVSLAPIAPSLQPSIAQ